MIADLFDPVQASTPTEIERVRATLEAVDPAVRAECEARAVSLAAGPDPAAEAAYAAANVTFRDGTAIVPIRGYMHKDITWSSVYGRTTSSRALAAAFDRLAADDDVDGVVLYVDSGGGSVRGIEMARRAMIRLRDAKPTAALADDVMASAAYYVASAAGSVHVTPSSTVGSIGAMISFMNISGALEKAGIRNVVVRSAPYKAIANSTEPITDEAVEQLTSVVSKYHSDFVSALVENLDITHEQAEAMANGKTHEGTDAVEAGLATGEATLDEVVANVQAVLTDDEAAVPAAFAEAVTPLIDHVKAMSDSLAEARAAVQEFKQREADIATREAEAHAAAEAAEQVGLSGRVEAAIDAAVASGRIPAASADEWAADAREGEGDDARFTEAAVARLEVQLGRLAPSAALTENIEEEEAAAEPEASETEREVFAQYPSLRGRL